MRLSRIIIFVADTQSCASFYRDHFGMRPIGEWSEKWAELEGGSCRLAFHQAFGAEGKICHSTGSPDNPHKIVFTVSDVEQTREEFIKRGLKMDKVFYSEELENLVLCDGYDPEGHRFQLCNR